MLAIAKCSYSAERGLQACQAWMIEPRSFLTQEKTDHSDESRKGVTTHEIDCTIWHRVFLDALQTYTKAMYFSAHLIEQYSFSFN
jgi:hypothetical protein